MPWTLPLVNACQIDIQCIYVCAQWASIFFPRAGFVWDRKGIAPSPPVTGRGGDYRVASAYVTHRQPGPDWTPSLPALACLGAVLKAFAAGRVFGASSGTGPPWVLALHGWRRSHRDFDAVLDGVAAIALDLPGFGATPQPPEPWSTRQYAEWIAPVLDELAPGAVRRRPFLRGAGGRSSGRPATRADRRAGADGRPPGRQPGRPAHPSATGLPRRPGPAPQGRDRRPADGGPPPALRLGRLPGGRRRDAGRAGPGRQRDLRGPSGGLSGPGRAGLGTGRPRGARRRGRSGRRRSAGRPCSPSVPAPATWCRHQAPECLRAAILRHRPEQAAG